MNLFNPKTLNRHIDDHASIPERHFAIISKWAELIRSKQIYKQKETALHGGGLFA